MFQRRKKAPKNTPEYADVTKSIKKRVQLLRNKKIEKEANEINEHANRKDVEKLYRSLKLDTSSFRTICQKQKCEPSKLKEYFSNHSDEATSAQDPN